jgi:hypothetical protein
MATKRKRSDASRATHTLQIAFKNGYVMTQTGFGQPQLNLLTKAFGDFLSTGKIFKFAVENFPAQGSKATGSIVVDLREVAGITVLIA